MAILDAMQAAALRLVGYKPTTFFGASELFENEICDLVNEIASDTMEYRDWQALIRTQTITGDGVTETFNLPADYDRMMIDSELQDLQSWAWGYYAFGDINQFLFAQARNFGPLPGGWVIYDNQLRFAPAPTGTATFPYLTKYYAKADDGTPKPAFNLDTDTFVLPERLLTLGLVWKWRQNKKMDYTGDDDAYSDALSFHGTKDGGSKVIRRTSRLRFGNAPLAWPWALG